MRTVVKKEKSQKIVIVGAGISGLTAGAYISRSGYEVLVLEKTSACGGLISSFKQDGFLFDTGPRAIGNAGILKPMLNDLNIDLPLVKSEVSTGIDDQIIHFHNTENINQYISALNKLFPESLDAIKELEMHISTYSKMARVLKEVDNPYFKNIFKDWSYLFSELIPWLPSFLSLLLKSRLSNKSVEELLASISGNQSLIDIVSQHFFKGTPAQFALGYFENFLDYLYPLGGTGELPLSIAAKIQAQGGIIRTNTEIMNIDPVEKKLRDQNGIEYSYDKLLWAADLKTLYTQIDIHHLPSRYYKSVKLEQQKILSAQAGESVFSIFLAVNEDPGVFRNISNGHFIYTPRTEGLGDLNRGKLDYLKTNFSKISKKELLQWAEDFCSLNSYEISIPVLRDETLAPEHKTGIIISLLVDGELFEMIEQVGWYNEFRENMTEKMIDFLEQSIYPGLKNKILFKKSSSPLTLKNMFNTANGAITGWMMEEPSPVPHSLLGIQAAVHTALPQIYKAGQWSYSPSGVPIAVLTGRIAAEALQKKH